MEKYFTSEEVQEKKQENLNKKEKELVKNSLV